MKQILILFMIILLTSCSDTTEIILPTVAETNSDSINSVDRRKFISDYEVYIGKELELSLYEPIKSCYIGAYILSNRNINFDMKKFDELTQKKHSTFIYNIRLGEPFPVQWVLECIAQMKTPHIVILEPNHYEPYDYSLLEETAKEFGEFYTPMFVQFYPNPKNYDKEAKDYIDFFIKARDIFKEHASNAAFVWSINSKDVYDSFNFYPGDEYVDWIGINVFEPIYKDNQKYSRDFFKDLEYFYYMYQSKKPIMISQLAISHYSNFDHTYVNKEAANKLAEIYTRIKNDYNRIKLINYMDVNNILISPKESVRDDYSITNDDLMLKTYRDSIADDYFLSDIQIMQSGESNNELIKSAFDVYEDGVDIFVQKKVLQFEMDNLFDDISLEVVSIKGEQYYKLSQLEEVKTLNIIIDSSQKKIILTIIKL